MYGKLFASAFSGSMLGAGPDVFAVWAYIIAHTVDSTVELNPRLLAPIIGMPLERVIAALDYLSAPDEASRTKTEQGRRIVRRGEYAYHVPNHVTYRNIKSSEELRNYMRVKQMEHREKKSKGVKARKTKSKPESRHTEAEAETESEAQKHDGDNRARVASDTATGELGKPVTFADPVHHAAYLSVRGSAKNPTAIDAVIGGIVQGMHGVAYPLDVIGAALVELSANGQPFNALLVRGYCRRLTEVTSTTTTALGEPSNAITRGREALFADLPPEPHHGQ